MKILFHLAHPAQYHLFKNTMYDLIDLNHEVIITYNEKDVLANLLKDIDERIRTYKLEANAVIKNKYDLLKQFVQKNMALFKILVRLKPDLILGTSIIIALNGKILKIPNIIVNEDDFDIIYKTAKLGFRFTTKIICPDVVRTGKWDYKCIKYPGYHELAYLHPDSFLPDKAIVNKYFSHNETYTIIRFAKLVAHHDTGIRGINDELALDIIIELKKYSKVYIISEREFSKNLEKYRIKIDPKDMHHILAFASLYIGDSQTMAAESGVLGTPFIRFNDFVGRISYLDELENIYKLGFGIKPDNPEKLLSKINEIFSSDYKHNWDSRRKIMLHDKINVSKLFTWLINSYPSSINEIKNINLVEVFQ